MAQGKYQTQQLNFLWEATQSKGGSGTFYIKAVIDPDRPPRTRIVVWQKGKITYASSNAELPPIPTLAQKLTKQFRAIWSESAVKFVTDKVANPTSARDFFEGLCKIHVLTWEQIESFCHTQTVISLEQILPYAGEFQYGPVIEFDLCYGKDFHGLDWCQLKKDITHRQEEWASLAPFIPSMEAVFHLAEGALEKISDRTVREHLQQWVDGKHSLVEIAENLDEDPLKIARLFLTYVQAGWLVLKKSQPIEKKELLTILSVDDSPIVQTVIKRTLGNLYNVLLASNAVDALHLLNQQPIALLLLDLTMPDIDGLEMCRILRSIPKFHELPIVMVTARDGLFDKIKGQIAGTNRYLTKPFAPEKLLKVVDELLVSR